MQPTSEAVGRHSGPPRSALVLYYRYPGRFEDLQQEFGREYTQLSRLFNETVDFVWEKHKHRIQDYLGFHVRRFDLYRRRVEQKGERFTYLFGLGVGFGPRLSCFPLRYRWEPRRFRAGFDIECRRQASGSCRLPRKYPKLGCGPPHR